MEKLLVNSKDKIHSAIIEIYDPNSLQLKSINVNILKTNFVDVVKVCASSYC